MDEDCRVEYGDRLIQTFRGAQDTGGDSDSLEDKWRRVERDHKNKSEEAVILYAALCRTAGFRPSEPDACWTRFEKIAKAGDILVGTRADVALRRIAINWGMQYIDNYSLHHCKCTLLLTLRTVARKCEFECAVQWFNLLLLRKEGSWPSVREEMENSRTSWPVTGTCLTPENLQELSKHCKNGKFDADLQRAIDFAVAQIERRSLPRDDNGLLKPDHSNAFPVEDEHMNMEHYMSHLRVFPAEQRQNIHTNANAVPSDNSARNSPREVNRASDHISAARYSDGSNNAVTPCRHTEALSLEIKDACNKISNDINDTLNRRFDDLSHNSEERQARYESAVRIHLDERLERSSQEHLDWLKELYNKLESDHKASETRISQQIDGLPSIHTISSQITELFSQVADGLTLILANTLAEHKSALLSQHLQVHETVPQETKLALRAIFQALMWQRDVQLRFAVILSKTADRTSESQVEMQTQQVALAEALQDRDERLSSILQLLGSQYNGAKDTSASDHVPYNWLASQYTSGTRSEKNNLAATRRGTEAVRPNDLHTTSTRRTGQMATAESVSDEGDDEFASVESSENIPRGSKVISLGPQDKEPKATRIVEIPEMHAELQEGAKGSRDTGLGSAITQPGNGSSPERHVASVSSANECLSTEKVGSQESRSHIVRYDQPARAQSIIGVAEVQATELYPGSPRAGLIKPTCLDGAQTDDVINSPADIDMMSIDNDTHSVEAESDLTEKVQLQKTRREREKKRRERGIARQKDRTNGIQEVTPTRVNRTTPSTTTKKRSTKGFAQEHVDVPEDMSSEAPAQDGSTVKGIGLGPQRSNSMNEPSPERQSITSQEHVAEDNARTSSSVTGEDAVYSADQGSPLVCNLKPSFPASDSGFDERSPNYHQRGPDVRQTEHPGDNEASIREEYDSIRPEVARRAYIGEHTSESTEENLFSDIDQGLSRPVKSIPAQGNFAKPSIPAVGPILGMSTNAYHPSSPDIARARGTQETEPCVDESHTETMHLVHTKEVQANDGVDALNFNRMNENKKRKQYWSETLSHDPNYSRPKKRLRVEDYVWAISAGSDGDKMVRIFETRRRRRDWFGEDPTILMSLIPLTQPSSSLMEIDQSGQQSSSIDTPNSDLTRGVQLQKERQERHDPCKKDRVNNVQENTPIGTNKTAPSTRIKTGPTKISDEEDFDVMEGILWAAPTPYSSTVRGIDLGPQRYISMNEPSPERQSITDQRHLAQEDATFETDLAPSPNAQPLDTSSVHIDQPGGIQAPKREEKNDSMPREDGLAYVRDWTSASVAADSTDRDSKGLRASFQTILSQETFVDSSIQAFGMIPAESLAADLPEPLQQPIERPSDVEASEAEQIVSLAGVPLGPWSPQDLNNRIQPALDDIAKIHDAAEIDIASRPSGHSCETYGVQEYGHTAGRDDQDQTTGLCRDADTDGSTSQTPIAALEG